MKSKNGTKAKKISKRTLAKREAKKFLKEWREAALQRASFAGVPVCERCGSREHLNVHHIINKRYKPLRYNKLNSLVLCAKCHKFDIKMAAHSNPIMVVDLLMKIRPQAITTLREYMEGKYDAYLAEKEKEGT